MSLLEMFYEYGKAMVIVGSFLMVLGFIMMSIVFIIANLKYGVGIRDLINFIVE